MTKTKRQLRAEAVERLNGLGKYVQASSIQWGLFGSGKSSMPPDELRDALVDLLTDDEPELTVRNEAPDDGLFRCSYCHCAVRSIDMTEGDCGYGLTFCPQCGGEIDEGDSRRIEAKLGEPTNGIDGETNGISADVPLADGEPPEGDPVSLMREYSMYEIGVILHPAGDVGNILVELADMVERDYVRREEYDKSEAWRKALHERVVDLSDEMKELEAERDEWKAKAEHDGVERSKYGVTRGMTNLEWLYWIDEEFAQGVDYACKCVSGFGIDYDNEREWLLAEHVDGCACDDASTSESGVNEEVDTRGKLEADIDGIVGVDHSLVWLRSRIFGWLDRQEAITERECREYEDALREQHHKRVANLRAELESARRGRDSQLPEGFEWPRFEDGELVKPFDKVRGFDDMGVQKFIYTTSANGSWQLQDAEGNMLNVFPMVDGLDRVKRPPLTAADGKPIEAGQTLYGESDGKAWTVDRIDRKRKWSVWAHDASDPERHKCLKPEWLTHEEPDSARRIMSDHTREVCAIIKAGGGVVPDEFAIANRSYIDRIEKLAGGCQNTAKNAASPSAPDLPAAPSSDGETACRSARLGSENK